MKRIIDAIVAILIAKADVINAKSEINNCQHKWKMYHEMKCMWPNFREGDIPQYIHQTLICKKCGAIKKITL